MYDEVRSRREGLDGSLMRLYQTMKILRSPSGCPWDRIQTEKSATESMLDESYEYLDAVLDKDVDHMKEEIGDVLINLMMNLIIAEESGTFPPADAVNDASDKLIRRHPHVFGEKHVEKAEDVLPIWDSVKKNVEGRGSEDAFFSSVPKSLPPLEESYEVQKKMRKVGFDWSDAEGVLDKVSEELDEVRDAYDSGDMDHVEEEIGDLLFSVVNLSRFLKVRPESALKRSNSKVRKRFERLSELMKEKGLELSKENVDEMEVCWEFVKREERGQG